MRTFERIVSLSGIGAMLIAIAAELYCFFHWIIQQPDLYQWTVQLY